MPESVISRTQESEASLIGRFRAGETAVFHDLIRPYERAMYIAARAILRDPTEAEDVVQDAALKAYTSFNQLRDDRRFKSWVIQIAINQAKMHRRKNRAHLYESLDEEAPNQEPESEFMPQQFADWREIPSEALDRKEIRQALEEALSSLPEIYREIFVLRDVQEMEIEEIAAVLGLTITNIKTRSHRARLMMREKLTPIFRKRWTDRLPFLKGWNPW